MKKTLSLLLAFLMFLVSATAFAAEERASLYFDGYGVTVTPKKGGIISFGFDVTGVEDSITLGVSTFQLQKKVDGEFIDVADEQTGSVGHNTAFHTFTRECQCVPGEIYRVKVVYICENSHGLKTQTYYSGSAEAKK